jgi:hypothetical protein
MVAFGLQRHANTQDHIDTALKFHDQYAKQKRIEYATKLLHAQFDGIGSISPKSDLLEGSRNLVEDFKAMGMEIATVPTKLTADGTFSNISFAFALFWNLH